MPRRSKTTEGGSRRIRDSGDSPYQPYYVKNSTISQPESGELRRSARITKLPSLPKYIDDNCEDPTLDDVVDDIMDSDLAESGAGLRKSVGILKQTSLVIYNEGLSTLVASAPTAHDHCVPQKPDGCVKVIIKRKRRKKGDDDLWLTKEQIQEAQEIFRTANKVTESEKALILGFMAGVMNDHPCRHLGEIVTIKLSEHVEDEMLPAGTIFPVVNEAFIQLHYDTGTYELIRKRRMPGE